MPTVVSQAIWAAKEAAETKALFTEFERCRVVIIEITTTGFTGTIDMQGKIHELSAYSNIPYIRQDQASFQSPSVAQLTPSGDTGVYRYAILGYWRRLQIVMTRSAGSITCGVAGSSVAAEFPITFAQIVEIEQEVYEIEHHLHGRERWCGKANPQTATDWCELSSLNPFRAISGDGDFGGDTNDEALVVGTGDKPSFSGYVKYDLHHIMVEAASNANEFVIRVIYGTGTMAAAESAGQYSEVMISEARKGSPVDIMMPRLDSGVDKVWIRAKNASDDAWIDFHCGSHEYER